MPVVTSDAESLHRHQLIEGMGTCQHAVSSQQQRIPVVGEGEAVTGDDAAAATGLA